MSDSPRVPDDTPPTGQRSAPDETTAGCRPKTTAAAAGATRDRTDHSQCAVCVEIGRSHPTHTYCFDCGRTMCEGCNLNHQQISAFREHVRINMTEEGSSLEEKLSSLVCQEHDAMVQKYCWDCSHPVCSVCLIFEHRDHSIKAFAYKTPEQAEKDAKLKSLIENKMSDLQAKMKMIERIRAKQVQHHRQLHQKISSHTENMMNQVCAHEHTLTEKLNTEHMARQQKLAQVQQKVERAKVVIDALMQRAGIVQQKQAELERLRALREQVLQLGEPPADGSGDKPEEEPAMTSEAAAHADAIKQKQMELAHLKELREQLRQLEVTDSGQNSATAQQSTKSNQEVDAEIMNNALEAVGLPTAAGDQPSLTDPSVILAIIRAIGEELPKLREEAESTAIPPTFVQDTIEAHMRTLELPEITSISQLETLKPELSQWIEEDEREMAELALKEAGK